MVFARRIMDLIADEQKKYQENPPVTEATNAKATTRPSPGSEFQLFGTDYSVPQWLAKHPLVVICIDGCDPSYLRASSGGKLYPNYWKESVPPVAGEEDATVEEPAARYQNRVPNFFGSNNVQCMLASSAMPSFTNPNNVSILTGVSPAEHGICGNYFYDSKRDENTPMNRPDCVRPDPKTGHHGTILSMLEGMVIPGTNRSIRTGSITSKDKLMPMITTGMVQKLTKNLVSSSSSDVSAELKKRFFSVEKSVPGIDMYTAESTLAVFSEAIKMQQDPATRCDVLYLSTTDFMQHKCHPFSEEVMNFYTKMDKLISELQQDCVVVATADHGMSSKSSIQFIGDFLSGAEGESARDANKGITLRKEQFRVVLPITDPYVAHHAALGSYATIYLSGCTQEEKLAVFEKLRQHLSGASEVMDHDTACMKLCLPPNDHLVGDVVVVGDANTAFGSFSDHHDLSALRGKVLRTHGGFAETQVPLIFDHRLKLPVDAKRPTNALMNYDIFPYALNSKL